MGFFSLFKKKKESAAVQDIEPIKQPVKVEAIPRPKTKLESHKVAGVSFKQEAIQELAFDNDDFAYSKKDLEDCYDEYEKVYEYSFDPDKIELVDDPDNEADPNAVKVIIDDIHVGYIKKGSCTHIKNLKRDNKILSIDATIIGGKYKMLVCDYDDDKLIVKRGKDPFSIKIELTLKDK